MYLAEENNCRFLDRVVFFSKRIYLFISIVFGSRNTRFMVDDLAALEVKMRLNVKESDFHAAQIHSWMRACV